MNRVVRFLRQKTLHSFVSKLYEIPVLLILKKYETRVKKGNG